MPKFILDLIVEEELSAIGNLLRKTIQKPRRASLKLLTKLSPSWPPIRISAEKENSEIPAFQTFAPFASAGLKII
jgi:hypothetical protein